MFVFDTSTKNRYQFLAPKLSYSCRQAEQTMESILKVCSQLAEERFKMTTKTTLTGKYFQDVWENCQICKGSFKVLDQRRGFNKSLWSRYKWLDGKHTKFSIQFENLLQILYRYQFWIRRCRLPVHPPYAVYCWSTPPSKEFW